MGRIMLFRSKEEIEDRALVTILIDQTIELIHCTKVVQAIRKLIHAHDILELNYQIIETYSKNQGPVWDTGSITELDSLGRELFVYHKSDFNPHHKFLSYREEINYLVRRVKLSLSK